MNHRIAGMLILAIAGTSLAGCGEKPPRLSPAAEREDGRAASDDLRRERTLHQGESRRIGI